MTFYQTQRTDEVIASSHSQSQYEVAGWSAPNYGRFTLGKYPVPIAQDVRWSSGPVFMDPKKLAPPGLDLRTVQLVLIRYTCLCYPSRLIAVTFHPDVKRFPLPWSVDQFWHFRINTATSDENCENIVILMTHHELKVVPVHAMIVSTGVPPTSLNLDTRWRLMVNFTPWPLYHRKMADTRLIGDRIQTWAGLGVFESGTVSWPHRDWHRHTE